MEVIIFLLFIVCVYFGYKKIKYNRIKKAQEKFLRDNYPNLELVNSVLKQHVINFSLDNSAEIEAKKQFDVACNAWAANDYKNARKYFQEAGASLGDNDVPQYKLDILIEIISNFAETDDLFHRIKDDALMVISKNPNILQTDIYNLLKAYSKSDIQYALYYAEYKNYITRTKKGRSYLLNTKA